MPYMDGKQMVTKIIDLNLKYDFHFVLISAEDNHAADFHSLFDEV